MIKQKLTGRGRPKAVPKVAVTLRLAPTTIKLLKDNAREHQRPVSWEAELALLTGLRAEKTV